MTLPSEITIDGRRIGPGHPVYVIAELSANHHHDIDRAIHLIEAAAEAGADAVKLQTYTADTITIKSDRPEFRIGGGTLWDGRTLHDLYAEASMPWDWQPRLRDEATRRGLHLFSSPFDPTAVDFLEKMGVPAYKVASPELVDTPLIRYAAATGKPLVISTGMGTAAEIHDAVDAAAQGGAAGVALLKCTSAYPAPPSEMSLATMVEMQARFGVPVGLSDHTLGTTVPVAAAALGACIIEKHLTLDRNEPGPDSAFSLEPDEFAQMVQAVHDCTAAVGTVRYGPSPREQASLAFRRSLYVVKDVARGERLTADAVRSIRPAAGVAPKRLTSVLGRRVKTDVPAGTPLTDDLMEP